MDVNADEWVNKAIENITKYLHRGGEFKGDEPQLIGGTDLLNTIGMAMGLPTSNPEKWTNYQLEKALKGELVFFENKAREAIDVVANEIRYCCDGDNKNFITVLPVELYYEGKLYELPVFRAQRYRDSKNYYIDNVGRHYGSFSDWFEFNKLPPGKMAYPYRLKLSKRSDSQKALVYTALTPAARVDSKTARALDTVAAIAGLGSSAALLFVTGGLAAPLVGTAIATAGWGTTRAGYQLIEKAAHGENINPFKSSESRMLWLGIAANLTSFGAMGASMRLTSLAARGREISNAFQVVTNIANGANLAVSGLAVINSTIFMIQNFDDLSAVDILMHGASIAFWTKGVYSYKTANSIIKEAQGRAFAHISKELSREEAAELSELRSRVQNDRQLLHKYHTALNSNISVKAYTQFLLDGMRYYDTVANLSPEQIEAFYSIRSFLKDDLNLISGLRSVSERYSLNPTQTVETVINMWQKMNTLNLPAETNAFLKEGNLILGRAPPIKIAQLPNLSPPLIRFFGEHLSQIDMVSSTQWATSVDTLLSLQSRGMFSCLVTRLVTNSGRAVVELNGQLQISIYKLSAISESDCKNLFKLISKLSSRDSSSTLSSEIVKLCVQDLRLRLECHRSESVDQTLKYIGDNSSLRELLQEDIKSFEKDRLYTFVNEVSLYKSDNYIEDMVKFASDMKPRNISEMVAYCEFAMACVEEEAITLKDRIRNKELLLPPKTKLSVFTREQAAIKVFQDIKALKVKFHNIATIVEQNDMVGVANVKKNLSNDQLIEAIKNEYIRFGSKPSAVYHITKHPTSPLAAFVRLANETVHDAASAASATSAASASAASAASATSATVSVGQDGDVRLVQFRAAKGRAFVLERDGCVFLCTFMPNK